MRQFTYPTEIAYIYDALLKKKNLYKSIGYLIMPLVLFDKSMTVYT